MDPFIGHCTYLTAAAELDHSDPNTPEKLKPLQKFLAKCWALSCGAFQLHPFSFLYSLPCTSSASPGIQDELPHGHPIALLSKIGGQLQRC